MAGIPAANERWGKTTMIASGFPLGNAALPRQGGGRGKQARASKRRMASSQARRIRPACGGRSAHAANGGAQATGSESMASVHPVFMALVIALVYYVLKLGLVRFAAVRLGRKGVFAWKRHVTLGKLAVAGLTAGSLGGFAVTLLIWGSPMATGLHAFIAPAVLALAATAFLTGLRLDREKKAGTPLALVHGANNILLAALCAAQAVTGWLLVRDFLW
jgi:hypothetical protein